MKTQNASNAKIKANSIPPVALDIYTKMPFMTFGTSKILAAAGKMPEKYTLSH